MLWLHPDSAAEKYAQCTEREISGVVLDDLGRGHLCTSIIPLVFRGDGVGPDEVYGCPTWAGAGRKQYHTQKRPFCGTGIILSGRAPSKQQAIPLFSLSNDKAEIVRNTQAFL